eukprot:8968701-Heterocapsa_arctica.AAC.1
MGRVLQPVHPAPPVRSRGPCRGPRTRAGQRETRALRRLVRCLYVVTAPPGGIRSSSRLQRA